MDPETKTLWVTTPALGLAIRGGAIVSLEDRRTGEAFCAGASWADLHSASTGAVCAEEPWVAKQRGANPVPVRRKPTESSAATFDLIGPQEGILTYTGLSEGAGEDQWRIRLRVEANGEVSFQIQMQMADPAMSAREVFLPLVNITAPAVVLGSGERFARGTPSFTSRAMRVANNIYAPPVGVIEGRQGVVGLWPEPGTWGYDDLAVVHQPERDELIPQVCLAFGAADPQTAQQPGLTQSSWWHLAPLGSWLDVARRYRAGLEGRTGAKPLWNQTPAWVRSIHAVTTERPGTSDPAQADRFYASLAQRFDPAKLLLFYWNGNCILLFGDHRYMTRFQYPTPAEIRALSRHGFRWIGYHPYVLVFSPTGMAGHLEETRRRGFGIPEGYTFQPDYAGPAGAEAFFDYFRAVATGYFAPLDNSSKLWVLHPGAAIVRQYLARNFGNYARTHQMSGCYLDILGADHAGHFVQYAPDDRRIVEGLDWRRGEEAACRDLKQANPELALMSEVQGEWTTIHTFYTWEGQSHLTHPQPVRLNHPLRAACWGSYTWTQTDSAEAVALLAGLPPVRLEDEWSVARAKLYCDEELFHDLPDHWQPEALAYFRARGGRWFQYRVLPWGDAYVELCGQEPVVRLGRLMGQTDYPLAGPARIQHWVAYAGEKPIGLDPQHTYPFIPEAPQPEGKLWITHLPDGAYVTAVRHAPSHTVVELGTRTAPGVQKVHVAFHGACLRVCDAATEHQGPLPPGTTAELVTPVPGGLVFLWEEPAPVDPRFTARFLGPVGHTLANGLPYRYWTANSAIHSASWAIDSQSPAKAVVEIGPGLWRGWTDQWVALAAGAQPVLRFDLGYAASDDSKAPLLEPLICSVRVNGLEVWRRQVAPQRQWQAHEISLQEFAGRTVLITLSAEQAPAVTREAGRRQAGPVRFGHVRIVQNPLPEFVPQGTHLPKPSHVLLDERFPGPALSPDWSVFQSSAHGPQARLVPEAGRLVFTGQHYKHQYIARPFPPQADSVHVLAEVSPTGCMTRWNPGLGLWWGPGRFAFVALGGDGLTLEVAGHGTRHIPLPPAQLPVFAERFFGWLRIRLAPEKLLFDLSLDGTTWSCQAEVPRNARYAGPPEQLILGRGTGGPNAGFQNDERWETGLTTCRLGELLVGSERP